MRRLAVLGTLVTLSSLSLGSGALAQDDGGNGDGQGNPTIIESAASPSGAASEPEGPDAAACLADPSLVGCKSPFDTAPSGYSGDQDLITEHHVRR